MVTSILPSFLSAGIVAPMAKRAGILMLRDKAMKYAWKSLQLPTIYFRPIFNAGLCYYSGL